MDSNAEKEFTAFVAARGHALVRTAYALCGDQHAAEDLAQSALAKAASRWTGIRGEPEHYVRRVLYREFVSAWRYRRRRPEHVVAEVPERPAVPDDAESRLALRALVGTLPPRQRAVIVLRYLEDVSVEQVAEMLGCSVGTVGSQTTRALAHLRRVSAPEIHPRLSAREVTP